MVFSVLESTPISKKSCKFSNSDWQLTTGGVAKSDSDEDCDADETLNVSLDANDIMEESCINDEQFAVLPKVRVISFIFSDIFILDIKHMILCCIFNNHCYTVREI